MESLAVLRKRYRGGGVNWLKLPWGHHSVDGKVLARAQQRSTLTVEPAISARMADQERPDRGTQGYNDMTSHERDRGVRKDLFRGLMHLPLVDQRFWLAQALLGVALLVHLGADLAQDQGIIPTPGFVWILLLFVPIVYAGSTFGLTGSVAVALEGIVFSIPQELLLPHTTTQVWGAWSILAMVLLTAILLGDRFDKERERHAVQLAAEHLETEQRFQVAFVNNVAGMTITDLSRRILAVNSSFCKILGRKSEEILGLTTDVFTFPEDRDIADNWTVRMLAREESEVIYTKRFLHNDGHIVWVEVSSVVSHF